MEALKFAQEKNLPVFVLGGGSNVLVSDKGFDGLVIRIQNSKFKIPAFAKASAGRQNSTIECDAGCPLGKIVNESIKYGLSGLEWAAGIPGTIGGAVRGNAGAPWGCMADAVENIRVLDISNFQFPISNKIPSPKSQSRVKDYKFKDCKFSYRNSIFKQNSNLIILSVELKLKKGNRKESEKLMKEILAKRKVNQPADFPSPGSFFKNPAVKDKKLISEFEKDTGLKIKENKSLYHNAGLEIKIPAGYLIDQLDLRGKKIGGAMVSEEHANFIVNTGNATAENVIMLAAIIKTKVRNKFGIQLQEEVQMVGF